MDDLISRQAVKELAHNQMREKYCGMALKKQRDFYIKLADSIIDLLPAVHPEPHWIPVTERLPEKSGEYLVTVKWVTGESDVDVYEYDARHKTWNDGESAGGERAAAWCNLPEPYKGATT